MLKKINFLRANTIKILLIFPLSLLANNAISVEKNSLTKSKETMLQQIIIKNIIIEEFCLNNKIIKSININNLPCEGYFECLTTKDNKTIIFAISPESSFTIITGAKTLQEVQSELLNAKQKKHFNYNNKQRRIC